MNTKKWLSFLAAAPQGLVWQSTLATASALLWLLAVPPFNLEWLAWFAFVPLLYALVEGVHWTRALWLGWLTGLLFTFFAENWIAHSMTTYGSMYVVVAYGVTFLFAALLAWFPALFAALQARLIERFGVWTLAFAPLLWVATEFIRPMLTGITWNAVGMTQVKTISVARLAQYGGVYLLSGLVVSCSTWLVLLTRMKQPRVRQAASVLLLFGALTFWMPLLQQTAPESSVAVNVLGVQPNIPVDIQLGDTTRYLSKTIAVTRNALTKAKPDLIVWAESPLTIFYENEEESRARLNQIVQESGAHFILNTAGRDEANHYFNSVTTITPQGQALKRYDKMRLLPFGEYVPWRNGLGRFVPAIVGDFTPGREAVVNMLRLETQRQGLITEGASGIERTTSFVKTGTFICYEAAFPDTVRSFVQQGATLLINVSEDAWFGPTAGAEQHLHHALMRAIETNRDIVRVTNTGISALLTADGRIVDALPTFTEGTQTWLANTHSRRTVYTRYGDWFAWASLAISALLLGLSWFRQNAAKN